MKTMNTKRTVSVLVTMMVIPSTTSILEVTRAPITKPLQYIYASQSPVENYRRYEVDNKKINMLALLNNSTEFTKEEFSDYEIGSSKFYNEGATNVISLEDIYGEF